MELEHSDSKHREFNGFSSIEHTPAKSDANKLAHILLDVSLSFLRKFGGKALIAIGQELVGPEPKPLTVRSYPLGFFQPCVPAGATVIVTSRPQVIFRPRRLMVPTRMGSDEVAAHFSIIDIRIGRNSQFVTAEELPATVFSENSTESSMSLDTANIGHDISITIRNNDPKITHDFRATMFGASVE